jgi:hypothetical protein
VRATQAAWRTYNARVALADRSTEILAGLPRGWRTARIDVTIEDPDEADRAAELLAPATPGRRGARFRLYVRGSGDGVGTSPELVRRVLGRLDEAGIRGRLVLVEHEPAAPEVPAETLADGRGPVLLAEAWDALVAGLPEDWSDLYVELEFDSSDFNDRGALLLAPCNPARSGGGDRTFRFRVARRFGYGASPGMARRCLERCDNEGITGDLRLVEVLSDTHPASTQGPVFRIGGRLV